MASAVMCVCVCVCVCEGEGGGGGTTLRLLDRLQWGDEGRKARRGSHPDSRKGRELPHARGAVPGGFVGAEAPADIDPPLSDQGQELLAQVVLPEGREERRLDAKLREGCCDVGGGAARVGIPAAAARQEAGHQALLDDASSSCERKGRGAAALLALTRTPHLPVAFPSGHLMPGGLRMHPEAVESEQQQPPGRSR